MYDSSRTVGVVIPMYNAAATIAETLASVRNQTYDDLDIVVVDDGSQDESRTIVEEICREDQRVRLVVQENSGVAAARNNGAKATNAPYLSFLDSDDLWAPDKIRAQMEVLEGGQPTQALVWCWYVEIDDNNVVREPERLHSLEGSVLGDLVDFYYLGNCSSMLMPRRVFEEAGGFDSTLRERGAQGCEDYAFALSVAERFPYKVVERYLVGYRITHGNMSGNTLTMWNSWNLVAGDLLRRHPEFAHKIDDHRISMTKYWYYRSLSGGGYRNALFFYSSLRKGGGPTILDLAPVSIKIFARRILDRISLGNFSKWKRSGGPRYLELAW